MMGTAGLKGLRVDCVVGVHEHERATNQPVILDVELDYDFAAAASMLTDVCFMLRADGEFHYLGDQYFVHREKATCDQPAASTHPRPRRPGGGEVA